jgi:archaellum component FlaC
MPEPKDLAVPMLREMRNQMDKRFDGVDARLEKIEARQESFSNALTADTMISKFMVGDFEERIEALEKKVDQLLKAKN